MKGNDYNALNERMTRIEMKLDELLGLFTLREMETPKPVLSGYRQRVDDAIAREQVNRKRREERARKKDQLQDK